MKRNRIHIETMSTDSKARHQVSSYGPPSSALMEESYDYGDSNFQRPRRPNPDTLSYIKVLPLSFQVAQTELKDYEHQVNNNNSNEYVDEESTSNNKFLSDEDKEEMIQSLLPTRIAAQSAIEEVQNEIASLAGDESGSAMMETLARIVSLSSSPSSSTKTNNASIAPDTESIRKMMQGLQGYHLHLASHRYGSHVVQTILQSAAKCLKAYDDPDYSNGTVNPNDSGETPLYELIQSAVNELIPHTKELAVHICGSHVIRTMLHVLAGAEVEERGGPASPVDKRGKQKKKKKKQLSKNMTQGPMNAGRNISLPLLKSHRYKNKHVAESFKKCLTQFVSAFIEGDSEETSTDEKIKMGYELQTLVCHPSAGPLLSILLRVLCIMEANDASDMNSNNNDSGSVDRDFRLLGILPCEAQYQPGSTADELVKAVLCWELDKSKSGEEKEEKDPNTSVNCGDIIYGLSGEPTGSIFLETILRTCASTDFYSEFCQRAGFFSADGIRDYTIHSVSNFVIQTLLATCRTKEQAESLCKGLFPCFNSSQKNEKKSDTKETENDDTLLPLLLQKRRRGVLWRLTELCAKWKVGQETLLNSIRTGFVSESEKSEEENKADVNDDSNNKSSKGRKRKKKAQSLPMDECVRKLLDFNVSSTIEGRISLDVNGARTIYHMLHFVPRLCSDILDTLVNKLSTEEIEKISMDGLGSRWLVNFAYRLIIIYLNRNRSNNFFAQSQTVSWMPFFPIHPCPHHHFLV